MSKIKKTIEYYRVPPEIEGTIADSPSNQSTAFANANRVIGDVDLYCDPSGDDTLNNGQFATDQGTTDVNGLVNGPWFSPDAAVEFLGDKVIDNTANVTIHLGKGVYRVTDRRY